MHKSMIVGTIFAFEEDKAIIILETGEFVSVEKNDNMQLGQYIKINSKQIIRNTNRKIIYIISSIAAIIVISISMYFFLYNNNNINGEKNTSLSNFNISGNIKNENTIENTENITNNNKSVMLPETALTPTNILRNETSSTNNLYDIFGIRKLYTTVLYGREWFNKWSQGEERMLTWGNDKFDNELFYRGEAKYKIFGNTEDKNKAGILLTYGECSELFVRDFPNKTKPVEECKKWNNVEVTCYVKLEGIQRTKQQKGVKIWVKTDHFKDSDLCNSRAYGGQMLVDGKFNFVKEICGSDSRNGFKDTQYVNGWNGGTLPFNTWIGLKMTARNAESNSKVKLEIYRDLKDGYNGGEWELICEFTDYEGWSSDGPSCCEEHRGKLLIEPNFSVFLAIEGIEKTYLKNFSVREIEPIK